MFQLNHRLCFHIYGILHLSNIDFHNFQYESPLCKARLSQITIIFRMAKENNHHEDSNSNINNDTDRE